MTLDEARANGGRKVMYQSPWGDDPQEGVITNVTNAAVFVQLAGEPHPTSTNPATLTLAPEPDPDRPCAHETFHADVEVNRIQASDDDPTIKGFYADVRIRCVDCDEPFRFTGVQAGLSPARPMCSPDETELRAPIRPASADPDFGMSMPGFSINVRHLDDGPHNIPPQIRDLMGREGGL